MREIEHCSGVASSGSYARRDSDVLGAARPRARRPGADQANARLPHALRPDRDRRADPRRSRRPVRSATSPWSITCCRSTETQYVRIKVALDGARRVAPDASPTSGPPRTGTSAKCGTCSGSSSTATRTSTRILMPPDLDGPSAAQGPSGARHRDGPVSAARIATSRTSRRRCAFEPERLGHGRDATAPTISCSSTSARSIPARTACCASCCNSTARRSSNAIPDIGFHHRGAEKMGERQSWHTYIPYTDRVDYLGGVMNNLPYLLAVEKLAGIEVPDRAPRSSASCCASCSASQPSGLVRHVRAGPRGSCRRCSTRSTTASALFGIIEAICGARMHPNWFRIGGVAAGSAAGMGRHGPRFHRVPARRACASTTRW